MKYYEKTKNTETFIMAVDETGNYSVSSNIDTEADGFLGPVDPFAWGYKESNRERAEKVLGFDPED